MNIKIAQETEANCILDITKSYGRSAGRRFQRLLENREQAFGQKLTHEEILNVYRLFDLELQKTLTVQN
jgi:hypothetical protein